MERNFETVMIEQCSPVLAGLKAAGLFRYETRDCKDLAERVRGWNARLGEKGLRVRVLKGCTRTHRYLVYVYRENRLPYVQRFFLAVSSDKSIIPCFSTLFNEIPVPAGGEEGAAQKEETKNFSKTLDTSPKLW